jgi:hypothetical protein
VKLTLKNYRIIEGKAIDVLKTTEKRGYLMIDNGREQQRIESTQQNTGTDTQCQV